MLIGELSRRTGVHAHQLRYYEAQGLLTPRRHASGYREYAMDTLRARLDGLDARIDTLSRSRQTLNAYIDATERRVSCVH